MRLNVNGKPTDVTAQPDDMLLWVIREKLELTGTKFGCGMAQCGACTVHLDGKAVRSCITRMSQVGGQVGHDHRGALAGRRSHPLQKAWIEEQVLQCGYCQSGQIMQAASLLKETPKPTRAQIVKGMNGNICRCGTYRRIVRAIQRASKEA